MAAWPVCVSEMTKAHENTLKDFKTLWNALEWFGMVACPLPSVPSESTNCHPDILEDFKHFRVLQNSLEYFGIVWLYRASVRANNKQTINKSINKFIGVLISILWFCLVVLSSFWNFTSSRSGAKMCIVSRGQSKNFWSSLHQNCSQRTFEDVCSKIAGLLPASLSINICNSASWHMILLPASRY